jgi:hypothetical protein
MIEIEGRLISDDLLTKAFVCDLTACKGNCCVQGDSGAPLELKETTILESILPDVLPFLGETGRITLTNTGAWVRDIDGELTTPLNDGKECAYTVFNNEGIALCGIEMAWKAGKISFKKPISCHLYPIRVSRLSDGSEALNYDRWKICDQARICGAKLQVKVYQFLKEPVIRAWGESFYNLLQQADALLENERLKTKSQKNSAE